MMRRTICVAVGFSALLFAQANGLRLTLQEARAMALKNHPQVLASQANYLRANEIVTETRSAYFPGINGEVTGSQASDNARISAGYLSASRLFSRFGTGITLSQLITDSGRTPNLVASSKLQAQASREDYQATRFDVMEAVGGLR
jgi:outer membrane protein